MTKVSSKSGAEPVPVVSELVETGNVDTVYRDVYLERARTVLGGALPIDSFHQFERQQADLSELPIAIARALEKGDWARVKELSERTQSLRQALQGKQGLLETARSVYAVTDVKLDPFSPGLQPFTKVPTNELPAIRDRAVERLTALARMDPAWKGFYAERRQALSALTITTSEQPDAGKAATPAGDPRAAAAQALKTGDMAGLAKLADMLMTAVGSRTTRTPASETSRGVLAAEPEAGDLLGPFSGETEAAAARVGLASRRLESRAEFATLRRYAWHPLVADESGSSGVKHVPLPSGTPEAFRERLEMLMIHPLVNSGGARHLPTLVAEDVLIEDFPELGEADEPPQSPLLGALELPKRRGLSRVVIERALLAHGGRVVRELGLDSKAYRLVCIPPDVHFRVGETEGWGRQPLWTHFDGYLVMAGGRLRALAGGNVQFGGIHDLLGLGQDYDSDRLVARFAVVRRDRMVAW